MSKPSHRVILGVTGSIAAYKAAELARLLVKHGCDLRVIMTAAATRFVGELTFRTLARHPVLTDMFDQPGKWEPAHLAWADHASALVIAPCTANVIAKLAHGLADDALTCVALACDAPLVLAPAMNAGMWRHPATQSNLRLLRERGARIIDPAEGELACGVSGPGRMAEPAAIMLGLRDLLGLPAS